MWNYIKSYAKFCGLAIKEKLPSGRLKLLRTVWLIIAFLLSWVISSFLGIKLVDVFKAIYHLMPLYVWAYVGLGAVILFLSFLIDGARHFHERTTTEANESYQRAVSELTADYKTRLNRVTKLSEIQGRAGQLEMLFYNREDESEVRPAFEVWAG